MHLTSLDRFLWAATLCGNVMLLLVLFWRGRAHSFPAFTAYVVESICTTTVLYFVYRHLSFHSYQECYWALNIVDELLKLLVFYELATKVFCPTGVWARDVLPTFIGVVSASVLFSVGLSWLALPVAERPIQTLVLRGYFFSAMLLSELFVGMVALSATAGLPWKTHAARIAQGLGTYSLFCVAKDIVVNYVGLEHHVRLYNQLSRVRIAIYLGCEVFWIVMLWLEAPAPRDLPPSTRIHIYKLQKQVEDDLTKIRHWRRI